MARSTHYVVQPYEIGQRGKVMAGVPVTAKDEEQAIRLAFRMEPKVAGVVAYVWSVDPELGAYDDDTMILCRLGAVPDEVLEASYR